MAIILCLIPLMMSVGPLKGQERSGFQFTSPGSLSIGWDSNFLLGSEQVDDALSLFKAPDFSLVKLTPRAKFFLSYTPEFELFREHGELNSWNHEAEFRLEYRVRRRATVTAGASLMATQDPARLLRQTLFILPRSRYREASLFVNFNHRLNRDTALDFRLDGAVAGISSSPAFPASEFNQMGSAATLMLSRRFGRQHRLSGGYSFLKPFLLNGQAAVLDHARILPEPVHHFNVAYAYAPNEHLSGRLSVGVVRNVGLSYVLSAELEKRTEAFQLGGGYSRYVSFFEGLSGLTQSGLGLAQGLLPTTVSEVVTFRLRREIGRRLALELSARASRTDLPTLQSKIEGLRAGARLDHQITHRLLAFVDFDFYGQDQHELLGVPISRKRYFGGIEILLGKTYVERIRE